MGHTKEPWMQYPDVANAIVSVNDPHVSILTNNDDGMAGFFHEEDARRVVACVNACAGFSTATLEATVAEGRGVIRALQRQRDELLAALKLCANQLEIVLPDTGRVHDERHALINAYAAIAKAEAA